MSRGPQRLLLQQHKPMMLEAQLVVALAGQRPRLLRPVRRAQLQRQRERRRRLR